MVFGADPGVQRCDFADRHALAGTDQTMADLSKTRARSARADRTGALCVLRSNPSTLAAGVSTIGWVGASSPSGAVDDAVRRRVRGLAGAGDRIADRHRRARHGRGFARAVADAPLTHYGYQIALVFSVAMLGSA